MHWLDAKYLQLWPRPHSELQAHHVMLRAHVAISEAFQTQLCSPTQACLPAPTPFLQHLWPQALERTWFLPLSLYIQSICKAYGLQLQGEVRSLPLAAAHDPVPQHLLSWWQSLQKRSPCSHLCGWNCIYLNLQSDFPPLILQGAELFWEEENFCVTSFAWLREPALLSRFAVRALNVSAIFF